MNKFIDITEEVLQLHELQEIEQIAQEVKEELQSGVPQNLSDEVDRLLLKINGTNANIVQFPASMNASNEPLFKTELKAASGQSLGNWFDQPVIFGNVKLDIRKIIGTDNEVDVSISSVAEGTSETPLKMYSGKTLSIKISVGETELLSAIIYVSASGDSADGEGFLNQHQTKDVSGSLGVFVTEIE